MISLSLKFGVNVSVALNAHISGLKPILKSSIQSNFSNHKPLKKFCLKHLQELLEAPPFRLEELKNEFKLAFKWSSQKERNELIHSVFDYKWFIVKKVKEYDAYKLAENLNVQSCPYCNAQFTKTIGGSDKLTRPTFDHFFAKADHPILALSFFNLIPCCRICNTDIKGTRPTNISNHFHPYIGDHDIEDSCRFTYFPNSPNGTLGFTNDFEIKILPLSHGFQKDRAQSHIEFFKLEKLYEAYKDQAAEIIQKQVAYPNSYLEQIGKQFEGLQLSKSEIYRLAFGNYLEDKDLLKRPLSKMTRDLSKHF